MDPNANLSELRDLVRCLMERAELDNDDLNPTDYRRDTGRDLTEDVVRVAELVQALDQWLSRAGFLPDDWRKALRPMRTPKK